MASEFSIKIPANFNLETAVRGHGWYDLAPFVWNAHERSLQYVFRCEKGRYVTKGRIADANGELVVKLDSAKVGREKAERDIRHILRLDDEMSEFYDVAASKAGTQWVRSRGAGRLLRSAT